MKRKSYEHLAKLGNRLFFKIFGTNRHRAGAFNLSSTVEAAGKAHRKTMHQCEKRQTALLGNRHFFKIFGTNRHRAGAFILPSTVEVVRFRQRKTMLKCLNQRGALLGFIVVLTEPIGLSAALTIQKTMDNPQPITATAPYRKSRPIYKQGLVK